MGYRYTECGLDNVILEGMLIEADDSGEETYTIPNVNELHRMIAHAVITQKHGMSGRELRFIRTEMGITQEELAALLHATRVSVSRWEREENPMDSQTEFMVRILAAENLKIDIGLSTRELASRCVGSTQVQDIRIDGSDPNEYRKIAA